MTFEDFVASLPRDPNGTDPSALAWRPDAWTAYDEEALERAYPYAVVQRLTSSDDQVFQNARGVEDTVIQLSLWQKPNADGTIAPRDRIFAVFYLARRAPESVDEGPMKQALAGFSLDRMRIPPQEDPGRPGFLRALLRFHERIGY